MFHIKLKYLRERNNLTREEVAKALNIAYTTLSNYENEVRQPDLNTLKNIAAYFKVSTDYLLDVPYNKDEMSNDLAIYFEVIKNIIKDSEGVYYNQNLLSRASKHFIFDTVEYISNQIKNIESDKN
ncbi:helix-turn-helix domain-containing protein [Ureibacillus chungkukjangi]|uniref:helix-turn-helix domain-containing protein n=1 Tax=Ureibacillus chungkukjangi TaxID=1202712 RepID=UPI0020418BD3|nr:helix-turn-helix transcriptional regulator [Ureibacillus chungkukjangi]MCM3387239.1 helix-turn-helix domain-containing protein [Ureibacillus chungkukjangi]